MKSKLYYVCEWGKKRELAWSGTYLSLYNVLKSEYDICEFNLKTSKLYRIKRHLVRNYSIPLKYDYGYALIKRNEHRLKHELQGKNECAFFFDEFAVSQNIHCYIYQDMCIEYLMKIYKEQPELWKYATYVHISDKQLEERRRNQQVFYSRCMGIFTMGKWLADFLVTDLGIDTSKVHNVGCGIDFNQSSIKEYEKQGKRILFVGRDFVRKGGMLVLDAFKILRERYKSDSELFIIGPQEKPYPKEIEGIHFLGPKSQTELAEYYNQCDIFCMPSFIEPFGKAFIEALVFGLPCIGQNSFAMKDIIKDGETGYLLSENNPDLLAQKMLSLLGNKEIQQNVLSKRDFYLHNYSWESVAKRIIDVINKDKYIQGRANNKGEI